MSVSIRELQREPGAIVLRVVETGKAEVITYDGVMMAYIAPCPPRELQEQWVTHGGSAS